MKPLRIIIAAMEPLLGQIVRRAVGAEPDMVIVGSVERVERLPTVAKQLRPDVVIMGQSDELPSDKVMQLLSEQVRPKLLVIGANGRNITRYLLALDQLVIEDVSPSDLVEAVRAAAKARGAIQKWEKNNPRSRSKVRTC